jgi:hypothetical protein
MSVIARDDRCEEYCCPECGHVLEYDMEEDYDNWWQWCFCAKHGTVDDEDMVTCDESLDA